MNTKNLMKNYIFFLCLLPILFSCKDDGLQTKNKSSENNSPPEKQFTLVFDRVRFESEKQLWTNTGIQDYSFRLSLHDNTGGESARVIVKNGTLCYIRPIEWNSIEWRFEEKNLYLPDMYKAWAWFNTFYRTIPEIHAYIERFIESYASKSGTLTVNVEYDSTLHYPKYFEYSWADPDGNTDPGSGGVFTIGIADLTRDPVVPEETSFTFNSKTFTEERQKWAAQNNRDYTFNIQVFYTSGDEERDTDYFSGKNPDYWDGQIVVRDGNVHELIPAPRETAAQPGEMVQAWVTSIDGIYAKVAEEAEKYAGETGAYIEVDHYYNPNPYLDYLDRIDVYFLRLSPESPDESFSYKVTIRGFEFPMKMFHR